MAGDQVAYQPNAEPISEGPLKGLPSWVRDLRNMFLSYGRQIAELTAFKAELEYAISEVGQSIILNMPEEVGRCEREESVTECAARLIKEYAQLRAQHDPMAARLAAVEKELESLKKEKQDEVPTVDDAGPVQKIPRQAKRRGK